MVGRGIFRRMTDEGCVSTGKGGIERVFFARWAVRAGATGDASERTKGLASEAVCGHGEEREKESYELPRPDSPEELSPTRPYTEVEGSEPRRISPLPVYHAAHPASPSPPPKKNDGQEWEAAGSPKAPCLVVYEPVMILMSVNVILADMGADSSQHAACFSALER